MSDNISKKIQLARERMDEKTNPIDGKTPAQVEAWVEANVTDLASAKEALIKIARILAILNAEIDELREKTS